jgi:hypothetical protein
MKLFQATVQLENTKHVGTDDFVIEAPSLEKAVDELTGWITGEILEVKLMRPVQNAQGIYRI